ncbi:MAG: chlorophyll synthesis pathway protein BchC [Pseudomonadota bacterium]
MDTQAILIEKPKNLRIARLPLHDVTAGDVVVRIDKSSISTGTERLLWRGEMPWFPGLEYPLVPGYEALGTVCETTPGAGHALGARVFVPGANCYQGARGLFGAAASRVVTPGARVFEVAPALGDDALLLALAATAQHALAPAVLGDKTLIIGNGVVGRLLARLMLAAGHPAPTVWEREPARRTADAVPQSEGVPAYNVIAPQDDDERAYTTIFDASGDATILDHVVPHLARGGEIVLTGFYATPLSLTFPPAFMREARIRIAAEWQPDDMAHVLAALANGTFSLAGIITHRAAIDDAAAAYETAFSDPRCTKMILEWSSTP